MKVRLTRQNKIDGKAGDIVEVSPARAAFLLQMRLAEPVTVRERIETPEKTARTAKAGTPRKTTRAKK